MNKHESIKAGYDLDMWEKYHTRIGIHIDLIKYLHWLICGNSGSGKSYFILMLLRNILVEYKNDIQLWFCDFKSSDDFAFLSGYSRYYAGEDCARGLEEFYAEYQQVKNGAIRDGCIRWLVFDEWAGFLIWETQQNKKLAEKHKGYILECLLMGRSMLCGVALILQRNDAKYVEGRDQFFVTVAFGKLNSDFKRMVMQGDELEQRDVYMQGEGIIRMDSIGTKFIKVPKLKDIDHVKQQIMDCLTQADTAEGGGGEASGAR